MFEGLFVYTTMYGDDDKMGKYLEKSINYLSVYIFTFLKFLLRNPYSTGLDTAELIPIM